MRCRVSLIAACSLNRVIGRSGVLPWQLPGDWSFFTTATRGQVLVLGRRSFQELSEPLANRHTIVVSPSLAGVSPDVQHLNATTSLAVVASLDDAITLASAHAAYAEATRIFVGGGEKLYSEALERGLVESCYITRVHRHIDGGDAFLPPWTTQCPHLTFARATTSHGTR
jgi:dihydrofolate reductase